MTTMLSLILAFMLTMGGSPAVSVIPVNSIGSESGVSYDITGKPRLGEFQKNYPVDTSPNAGNPRLVLNLSFQYKKPPLINLNQAFGMNPVNFTDPLGNEISANTIKYWGSYEKALKYVKYNYGLYLAGGDSAATAYNKLVSNGLITDIGSAYDRMFAFKLAMSPSLDVFDVTPAQFAKDVLGGVINAVTSMVSIAAKGLPGGYDPYLWMQIDEAQNWVQSKVNSAIGANEGSLGYWMGETYAPAIAGGWLTAEIELANATAQTGKTLPFLGSEPVKDIKLLEAWERYKLKNKKLSFSEWKKKYEVLMRNRAKGEWAESLGQSGETFNTPYGKRVIDNAPATEIKTGNIYKTKFVRKQVLKDVFLRRTVPGYEPIWRIYGTISKPLENLFKTFGIRFNVLPPL